MIHNHGPEDKQWPSPLDILSSIEHMDPRVGLCIDVGHTVRAGTDVVEAIRKGGPRVFDLHIKDLADAKSKESQVAVGDGMMPVPEIFKALKTIGYKGYVDLEYEIHEEDPLPGMIKASPTCQAYSLAWDTVRRRRLRRVRCSLLLWRRSTMLPRHLSKIQPM